MRNKLFVFGCSYATGEELLMHELGELDEFRKLTKDDPRKFFKRLKDLNLESIYEDIKQRQRQIAWPQLLADKLGYNCINLSESGNSLDKIVFQLYKSLDQNEIDNNDLVIISLTKSTRNAVFDKTVESFQLPSLQWPVKTLMGVKDTGDVSPVISEETDKALLSWFTDDRIAWDFVKNLLILTNTRNVYIVPAMSNNIKTNIPMLDNVYQNCTKTFLTNKGLDDFTSNKLAWGHPDADAHKKYADHLYAILRKL